MSFGTQLKKFVKARGLTFMSLADQMGVNNVYLSQIVTGFRTPGRDTLRKLAVALGIPVDVLLTLGADVLENSFVPRKVAVLTEAGAITWIQRNNMGHPAIYADNFEYASTIDPHAFYFQPVISKGPSLGSYDLVLIEPGITISNGDTVLTHCRGEFLLGKIVIAHGFAILLYEKQKQILISQKNLHEGLSLFRAIQGIRNI